MIKKSITTKFKNWWGKLSLFKRTNILKTNRQEIPNNIHDEERIARSVFSPININPKTNALRNNIYKSRGGTDEVSVNRLDYTSADFCKKLSKRIENPKNKRTYFGIAILFAKEIRNIRADVIYSPISKPKEYANPYHADIKVGHITKVGQQPPAQISYMISKLSENSRLYIDPNPEDPKWTGNKLE